MQKSLMRVMIRLSRRYKALSYFERSLKDVSIKKTR